VDACEGPAWDVGGPFAIVGGWFLLTKLCLGRVPPLRSSTSDEELSSMNSTLLYFGIVWYDQRRISSCPLTRDSD
jgi:hypothetical protein